MLLKSIDIAGVLRIFNKPKYSNVNSKLQALIQRNVNIKRIFIIKEDNKMAFVIHIHLFSNYL